MNYKLSILCVLLVNVFATRFCGFVNLHLCYKSAVGLYLKLGGRKLPVMVTDIAKMSTEA
jgi:hypothetical protein